LINEALSRISPNIHTGFTDALPSLQGLVAWDDNDTDEQRRLYHVVDARRQLQGKFLGHSKVSDTSFVWTPWAR